jgi:hypothetical protein
VIGVLQGSIGAVHINQAVLPAVQRPPRHQILPVPDTYVPRRVVEDQLNKLLKTRRGRLNLVELYGQPGSGKSTVGQKVAGDLADEFPDGRLWVEVGDRSDIDILWELIDPFDAPPERSPFRNSDQYRLLPACIQPARKRLSSIELARNPGAAGDHSSGKLRTQLYCSFPKRGWQILSIQPAAYRFQRWT